MSLFYAFVAILHFALFVFGIYFFVILSQKVNYDKVAYKNFILYYILYTAISLVGTRTLAHITNNDKLGAMAYSAFPIMLLILPMLSYSLNQILPKKGRFLSIFFAILLATPTTLLINVLI